MKRTSIVASLLCLALVAVMAMAVAPAALAKAETMSFTAEEYFANSIPGPVVVTGAVAHMEFHNFYTHVSDDPRIAGTGETHLVAIVDPVDGDANIRGTWTTWTDDGTVSEGTFNGTMNMFDLTWDCMIRGVGVSGPGAGTLVWCRNLKTEEGFEAPATLTGTLLAPRGF
jgi:hypothetical protein